MGPPMMLRIIFALMDSHERIFKAMDGNKDGQLTLEEMQAFMHGTGRPVPQPILWLWMFEVDQSEEHERAALELRARKLRALIESGVAPA
jgi:EF hand